MLDCPSRGKIVGVVLHWVALAVEAWMVHIVHRPDLVTDSLAPRLLAAVAGRSGAVAVVDALLAVRKVFGDDLAADATFLPCSCTTPIA